MLIAAITLAAGLGTAHRTINRATPPAGVVRSRAARAATPIPLADPQQLATDVQGNLYVANFNKNDIVVYNPSYVQQTSRTIGNLNGPQGVAVNPYGNVFASNTNGNNVMEFNAAGALQTVFATGISTPTEIAVDALDDLYVVNNTLTSLSVFARSGVLTQSYRVGQPLGSMTAVTMDGPLLLTSQSNAVFGASKVALVQSWDADSLVTGNIAMHDNTFLRARSFMSSIAADASGAIWASIPATVRSYSNGPGQPVSVFKSLNYFPSGIAVDSARMRVDVSDDANNAIHVYGFAGQHIVTIQ